ncbi:Spy/CpxP family protein refolding chaperone [Caenimonas terrae]|uniref:Spy/CpxP family protein refolding chaperone n=1 Tax=Caenimonas terrae TaxID=696074 RepID=A0ABW0N9J9_9BURK
MTHSPKQLIAALMLAGLGFAAVAQMPPGPPPGGPGRMERMERPDPAQMQQFRQQRHAQRMAKLKDTLQITAAQEGAWSAWTAAMQPPANWKRPDRAELEHLSTPERIDRMRALRAERNAMADRRADATKAFYATLNPTQKRVFDVVTTRHGHGGRGEREGGRGERHGWGR